MALARVRPPIPRRLSRLLADGAFAGALGVAVVVGELVARSRQQVRESAQLTQEQMALRRVATLVAQSLPPSAVFDAVVDEVTRLLDPDMTILVRFDTAGEATFLAGRGQRVDGMRLGCAWRPDPNGPVAMVWRTGGFARLDDISSHRPESLVDAIQREGLKASVASPITVAGRLWGTVSVSSRRGPLPADTEQRLGNFTDLAATAIANADSRSENASLLQEQRALRHLATLAAGGTRPGEICTAAVDEVNAVLGADVTFIVRLDLDGAQTVVARAGGRAGTPCVPSRGEHEPRPVMAEVLRTGRPARRDDYGQAFSSFLENTGRTGIESSVAVPILVEGRLWGGIGVGMRGARFPEDSERRMTGFAELVATAVGNTEHRAEVARLLDEQGALRRVATLVAHRASPEDVLSAVAEEVCRLFGADNAAVTRFEPDETSVLVVGSGEDLGAVPAGTRWAPHDHDITTAVARTGCPARLDDSSSSGSEPIAHELGRFDLRSVVASPIVVDDRLWGAMVVSTKRDVLPADTEKRVANFCELVATAIGNTESRAELAASRARVVAASDQARRRIERDLHDGAQQRLVSLGLELRLLERSVPQGFPEIQEEIGQFADQLTDVLDVLREMSRGIHPAILSEGGLGPALRTLARHSAVPVELDLQMESRFPEPVEVAAYYVVSETLTNTTKHAHASHARVAVREGDGTLQLSVRDDGVGGADPGRGSGLIGLRDRVEALGGSIDVRSPSGDGTLLVVTLPIKPC